MKMLLLRNTLVIFSVFLVQMTVGQVKIGDNPETIDVASLLELESSARVLVLTRVSNTEMSAINPLNGALVYNTDEKCVFYYDDSTWVNLCNINNGTDGTDGDDGDDGDDGSDGGDGGNGGDGTGDGDGSEAGEGEISITENGAIIYTYTNEDGEDTVINIGEEGILHVGEPGGVFFASADGTPTEDVENLFWNNTDKRLGIGTNDPDNELEVDGIIKSGRISNSRGTAAFPSYHFTGSFNSGMWSPAPGDMSLASEGEEVVRLVDGARVGVMVTNPEATLHVGGDLRVDGVITDIDGNTISGIGAKTGKNENRSKPIRRVATPTVAIAGSDHTLIVTGTVTTLQLPVASLKNKGLVIIVKDQGGLPTSFDIPYRNLANEKSYSTQEQGVLWLQSDGAEWQQID